MDDQRRLRTFLSEQKYMTIAVTLADGSPWAVPVRIKQWDGNHVFEWDSKVDTEHSRAIERDPRTAITMFEKNGEAHTGVYMSGKTTCTQQNEHGTGRYRFTAEKLWLNDESFVKREVRL